MKIYDVIILGAGASGLMCASHLSKSLDVAIVDGNEKIAKKLKISGGGKCNVTNIDVSEFHYDGDDEFISYSLNAFSKEDLLEFLALNGVELEVRKNRYYFCKKSSDEIINIFRKETENINFFLNETILEVKKVDKLFQIKTNKKIFQTKKVIVATGAKSFKNLGASEIGLNIAKSFNIKVKEFSPALVGLTLQPEQFWMKELSGLSCYVNVEVENKILKEEMLFAHKGVSGPVILSTSLYWKKGEIRIDFLPNDSIEKLIHDSKKLVSSAIPLPKRLSKAILKALDVNDVECRKISKIELEKLLKIHSYSLAPAGNFGFTKAEVCRGGVLTTELNPISLESYKVENLHFIGEVVDVTGELGGYNFQWAFSSAYSCAKSI